jgi:hypothetical protein
MLYVDDTAGPLGIDEAQVFLRGVQVDERTTASAFLETQRGRRSGRIASRAFDQVQRNSSGVFGVHV